MEGHNVNPNMILDSLCKASRDTYNTDLFIINHYKA